MNIIKDKAYDETKIYLRSIFFDKYISDEIKHNIGELYNQLTIDNSYDIRKQAQIILLEYQKLLLKDRVLENRIEDQPIFQGFILLGIMSFISFMLAQSILNSDKNQRSSKLWDNVIKIFLGIEILTIVLFVIYCVFFNYIL